MNIIKDGELLGTVIIPRNNKETGSHLKHKIVRIILGVRLMEGALVLIYTLIIYKTVVKPFKKLEKFANEVAKGHLDFPLEMDKENIFGTFTESFDIMREELNLARKRKYEVGQSKKELIAALSHDIKTPVTGIKLMSELLALQVENRRLKKKLIRSITKQKKLMCL